MLKKLKCKLLGHDWYIRIGGYYAVTKRCRCCGAKEITRLTSKEA